MLSEYFFVRGRGICFFEVVWRVIFILKLGIWDNFKVRNLFFLVASGFRLV